MWQCFNTRNGNYAQEQWGVYTEEFNFFPGFMNFSEVLKVKAYWSIFCTKLCLRYKTVFNSIIILKTCFNARNGN